MTKENMTPKTSTEDAKDDVEDNGDLVADLTARTTAGTTSSAQETNSSPSSKDSSPAARDEQEKKEGELVNESNETSPAATPSSNPWQAIFSPQYNAYYFYNTETQQTTWENPLAGPLSASAEGSASPAGQAKEGEASSSTSVYPSQSSALQDAALAAGIDPALAHLDPTLLAAVGGAPGASASGLPPAFTAKFNARTGQFTRPDGRDPTHLSEHARAQRMSEFYFDVNSWQEQLAEQGGSIQGPEESRKRKRPSKKDLDRFKEQKKQKKLAKTAWLRT